MAAGQKPDTTVIPPKQESKLIVVSGLSGSGKSEAIHVLEDCGYFCVDNLPTSLLMKFLELCDSSGLTRVGIVVDIREREFTRNYPVLFQDVLNSGRSLQIIFLEASDEVIIKRYKETRRLHPLASAGLSIESAVNNERHALSSLRDMAHLLIDTSNLNVHQLRKVVLGYVAPETGAGTRMVVAITSFGFKYGLPKEADLVFDVRFLPNPYFVDDLRSLTGTNQQVADFVMAHEEAVEFMDRLYSLLEFTIPLHEQEGKPYLTIAIGCTGGRHRSVALAALLAEKITGTGRTVTVRHRDIDLG